MAVDMVCALDLCFDGALDGRSVSSPSESEPATSKPPATPPGFWGGIIDGDTEALAADSGVTKAVEQLLGLSFEHFTSCVVLPQGDFAEAAADEPDLVLVHRRDDAHHLWLLLDRVQPRHSPARKPSHPHRPGGTGRANLAGFHDDRPKSDHRVDPTKNGGRVFQPAAHADFP